MYKCGGGISLTTVLSTLGIPDPSDVVYEETMGDGTKEDHILVPDGNPSLCNVV